MSTILESKKASNFKYTACNSHGVRDEEYLDAIVEWCETNEAENEKPGADYDYLVPEVQDKLRREVRSIYLKYRRFDPKDFRNWHQFDRTSWGVNKMRIMYRKAANE